jgi:hypothetical protein
MLLATGPNGDGRLQVLSVHVSQGTVVLGAEGQINTFAGSISVGHYSTAAPAPKPPRTCH